VSRAKPSPDRAAVSAAESLATFAVRYRDARDRLTTDEIVAFRAIIAATIRRNHETRDPTRPEALGLKLAEVRRAHGAPRAWVDPQPFGGWIVRAYVSESASGTDLGSGETEAEALADALRNAGAGT